MIKTVSNYSSLAPHGTRQRDGDEKVQKTCEVYFGFSFSGEERISPRRLQNLVCNFKSFNYDYALPGLPAPRCPSIALHPPLSTLPARRMGGRCDPPRSPSAYGCCVRPFSPLHEQTAPGRPIGQRAPLGLRASCCGFPFALFTAKSSLSCPVSQQSGAADSEAGWSYYRVTPLSRLAKAGPAGGTGWQSGRSGDGAGDPAQVSNVSLAIASAASPGAGAVWRRWI